jgi:hypothetical protein
VVCWRADTGVVERVAREPWRPVAVLATDGPGRLVLVLQCDDERGRLRSYVQALPGQFRYAAEREFGAESGATVRLAPAVLPEWGDSRSYLQVDDRVERLRGTGLLPLGQDDTAADGGSLQLVWNQGHHRWVWAGRQVTALENDYRGVRQEGATDLRWLPGVSTGSPLLSPPFDWLTPAPGRLELTGVTEDGVLYWSAVEARPGEGLRSESHSATHEAGFRATACVGPGHVAGVTAGNDVYWFASRGTHLTRVAGPHHLSVPARAVAAAFLPPAGALAVVFADGTAVRVPRP